MSIEEVKNKIKNYGIYIIYGVSITILSSLMINILMIILLTLNIDKFLLIFNIMTEVCFIISFCIFPIIVFRREIKIGTNKYSIKRLLANTLIYIVIAIVLVAVFPIGGVLHLLVVGFVEEVHFRKIQYEYFQAKTKDHIASMIISSLIFAFVIHMNENILENFLLRFPLGIALCMIKEKFGLSKSILLHWIYDVIVLLC